MPAAEVGASQPDRAHVPADEALALGLSAIVVRYAPYTPLQVLALDAMGVPWSRREACRGVGNAPNTVAPIEPVRVPSMSLPWDIREAKHVNIRWW